MSSTHAPSTAGHLTVGRSPRRTGLPGPGAVLASLTAVGTALAIVLAPTAAPRTVPTVALPAMDSSMGFWDRIDTRPAVSINETSMGYWDHVDSRPSVSPVEANQGYWEHVDARPAVSAVAGR